jgi:hypothetical protein
MRVVGCIAVALVSCDEAAEAPSGPVTLDGPAVVTTRAYGPVEGAPRLLLGDGSEIEPTELIVEPAEVARAEGDVVIAVGPGDARVTVLSGADHFVWTLQVRPDVRAELVRPPEALVAGAREPLSATVLVGGVEADVPVTWSCQPADVCRMEGAVLETVGPGAGWLTAHAPGGAAAVHEFLVVAP